MSQRVVMGLRAVQAVAGRTDPTAPLAVGALAQELGLTLSRASRLLAELDEAGFAERSGGYGAYRVGSRAVRLSGRAAAPVARSLRYAMTLAGQLTGETVCLAVPVAGGMRVIASVESLWTLHAPAEVGELITDAGSAIVRSAPGRNGTSWQPGHPGPTGHTGDTRLLESTIGMSVEIATPVFGPDGDCVAVLAVRLPTNRYGQNAQRSRHAVDTARRSIESTLVDVQGRQRPPGDVAADGVAPPSALEAAFRVLEHLAAGRDSVAGTARATGLRADRVQRLIDACRAAGMVVASADRTRYQLGWAVHGWHRAAFAPTIVERAKPLVAATANETRTCGFITVLKGMRSFTLVEELEMAGEGLRMAPWIGRPHPMIGSDGGPTLVMDLTAEEVAELFPTRHSKHELVQFLSRVREVVADGVLTMQAYDDAGIVSISAPVRDSSGFVAAAVCIVGTTSYMRDNARTFEEAARKLAADVSAILG
jgi:DNA-binding IclR family transcriptional regulator